MATIIDSHHHFWQYTEAEYGWLDESRSAIRRDFLPADLATAIKTAGVNGVISVHARQTLEETWWLLKLAEENEFIKGVVGWVPLVSERVHDELKSVATHPKLRGVRHVPQGETEDGLILRDDFNRGISALKEFGLVYDILVYERQLPQTIKFVDKHPAQTFVLDHIGKPSIKTAELEPWASRIKELARRQNVYCKVSGMVTEADWQSWTSQSLQPYFDVVLNAFGPDRLMAGSDWPVCLVACGYKRWMDILQGWTGSFSETQKEQFFGGTAMKAYGIKE